MADEAPRYPQVVVKVAQTDGNVYAVIGACRNAMRKAGVNGSTLIEFSNEAMNSKSYDDALNCCMRWVRFE